MPVVASQLKEQKASALIADVLAFIRKIGGTDKMKISHSRMLQTKTTKKKQVRKHGQLKGPRMYPF